MAYHFNVDGKTYIGRTIPGASRMRIYESRTDRFIVAFDPDTYSLRSRRPCGSWTNIQADTGLELLQKLQPQILSACRKRLEFFDSVNNPAT